MERKKWRLYAGFWVRIFYCMPEAGQTGHIFRNGLHGLFQATSRSKSMKTREMLMQESRWEIRLMPAATEVSRP